MKTEEKFVILKKLQALRTEVDALIELIELSSSSFPVGQRVRILEDVVTIHPGMESDVGKIGVVKEWDGFLYTVAVPQRIGTKYEKELRLHFIPSQLEEA